MDEIWKEVTGSSSDQLPRRKRSDVGSPGSPEHSLSLKHDVSSSSEKRDRSSTMVSCVLYSLFLVPVVRPQERSSLGIGLILHGAYALLI